MGGGINGKTRVNIHTLLLLLLSHFSRVRLCATPQRAAHQAPPSLGSSRQEHWSGLPCPPPGDLPDPGIEPVSLMSRALTGWFFTTRATWEAPILFYFIPVYSRTNLGIISCQKSFTFQKVSALLSISIAPQILYFYFV